MLAVKDADLISIKAPSNIGKLQQSFIVDERARRCYRPGPICFWSLHGQSDARQYHLRRPGPGGTELCRGLGAGACPVD